MRSAEDGIVVVNPLSSALSHYVDELVWCLGDATILGVQEPSIAGFGRWKWLIHYLRLLQEARRDRSALKLVVWPVVGYFDFLVCRLFLGTNFAIVVHDAKPLVRATGYGHVARCLAGIVAPKESVVIHSAAARTDLNDARLKRKSILLPHPMLPPRCEIESCESEELMPIVRVLGQYKPDRDVEMLAWLPRLVRSQARFEIVGRGWEPVEGWQVTDAFVSEEQMDELIRTSAVVLIPYRRFYQSGIAVRTLERGVPVVGPRESVLSDTLGADSPWLVPAAGSAETRAENWSKAIDGVLAASGSDPTETVISIQSSVAKAWQGFCRT